MSVLPIFGTYLYVNSPTIHWRAESVQFFSQPSQVKIFSGLVDFFGTFNLFSCVNDIFYPFVCSQFCI